MVPSLSSYEANMPENEIWFAAVADFHDVDQLTSQI